MNSHNSHAGTQHHSTPSAQSSVIESDLVQAVQETLMRMYLDFSQPLPDADLLQLQAASWADRLNKAGVSWDVVMKLYDMELSFRAAKESGHGFVPTVADLLHQWDKLCEEGYFEQAYKERTGFTEPDYNLWQLPEGQPGPGRRAATLLRERMAAGKGNVGCECKGHPPAERSQNSLLWRCASLQCGFSWPTEDTMNAPYSSAPGGLAMVAGQRGKFARQPKQAAKPKWGAMVEAIAADCNINLDACSPEQITQLREFGRWWSKQFTCRLSPQMIADHWGTFELEQQMKTEQQQPAHVDAHAVA